MKKIFLFALFLFSVNCLADHSLADAMSMNDQLKAKVMHVIDKWRVACDSEFSNQTGLDSSVEAKYGNGFKQIALCYRTHEDLMVARSKLRGGLEYGLYSLDNVAGVLVVSYSWGERSFKPEKIISVVYR